jgi:hypothetical protein
MDGLDREYLPKGTDFSADKQLQLDAFSNQIDNLPLRFLLRPQRRCLKNCYATANNIKRTSVSQSTI